MPDSWTARGALLLTMVAAAVLCSALWLGLPPEPAQGQDYGDAIGQWEARTAFIRAWMGAAGSLLTVCAGAWAAYGARNLPTAYRASTSAEKAGGITIPASVRGEP